MGKKRGLGGLLSAAALLGAGAAIVSYFYKYQKFSDEVDQDFTDVVGSASEVKESAKRSYTVLKNSKNSEDLKAAARDLGYAAKNLAIDTKNLAVDAGKDAYRQVREALDSRFSGARKEAEDVESDDSPLEEPEVEVEFYHVGGQTDTALSAPSHQAAERPDTLSASSNPTAGVSAPSHQAAGVSAPSHQAAGVSAPSHQTAGVSAGASASANPADGVPARPSVSTDPAVGVSSPANPADRAFAGANPAAGLSPASSVPSDGAERGAGEKESAD